MTEPAERFAARAEEMVGAPFRLHGRDPATGVDCVGLVACALEEAGISASAPRGYALRNLDISALLGAASRSGFCETAGQFVRGDLLLVRPGPAQHHLVIALEGDRLVHAHATLGRVVIQQGLSDLELLKHWRLARSAG